jgi:N-acetylmuramoyl-L-alanine amidase
MTLPYDDIRKCAKLKNKNMNQIQKTKLNLKIKNDFNYTFEITEDGVCIIEIIASAKSWWQNLKEFKSFFQDDDLAVKIDGIEFSKLNKKRGLFDGEAAWNGNNLRGLSKTNIFVVNLDKGVHNLEFLFDEEPTLESIAIVKHNEAEINYIPEENNPAQDGNRRQWMTIIPVNVAIKNLSVIASAGKNIGSNDDDDIKLIIDSTIQTNETEKSHKNWFWCGKILNKAEKEFSRALNLERGLHYIELWADKSPFLKTIRLELGDSAEQGKRTPTVDDPEHIGNFNDDTEQLILARAIFGEARGLSEEGKLAVGWTIKNRVLDSRWGNTYKEVILEPHQYSAFNEQDPNWAYVKNPLIKETQKKSWYECYKIAGKIIKNKIGDPTDGANHYFSDYIAPPYWAKSDNAEFKLKIGNTLFYDLKKGNKGGFIDIKKILFIFIVMLILLLGGLYAAIKINNKFDCEKKLSGTSEAEVYKHFFLNPKTNEVNVAHFDKNGNFLRTEQITSDGYPKSNLDVLSDFEMIGYFQDVHKNGEGDAGEEYYKNYITLLIKNSEYEKPYEVYRGDFHTSSWNWVDKNHVVVNTSCGSGCQYFYKINILTKETEEEGQSHSI